MVIEVSGELEDRLRKTADAEGLSVDRYVERLLTETTTRRAQLAEFRAAIAERLASLNAGESEDGEEVMSRLVSGLGAV